MQYTEQGVEQIVAQLRQIKIHNVPVFLAHIDEVDSPYHKVYVDAGISTARFEFKKAPEQEVKDE